MGKRLSMRSGGTGDIDAGGLCERQVLSGIRCLDLSVSKRMQLVSKE